MITCARSKRRTPSGLRTATWSALLALVLAWAHVSPVAAQSRRAKRERAAVPAAAEASSESAPSAPTAPSVPSAPSSDPAAASATPTSAAAATPAPETPAASQTEAATTPAATMPAASAIAEGAGEARAVREELSSVMDALVSARARAALLGKSLFETRVRVVLVNEAAEDQALGKVALFLDGNPIFRGEGSALNAEGAKLFEGYAAPGPHVLKVVIEQRSRHDDNYRYSQESALRFTVLREHLTDLKLVLDDDSDIAEDFADDQEGEYDVRLRLEVHAEPLRSAEGS